MAIQVHKLPQAPCLFFRDEVIHECTQRGAVSSRDLRRPRDCERSWNDLSCVILGLECPTE